MSAANHPPCPMTPRFPTRRRTTPPPLCTGAQLMNRYLRPYSTIDAAVAALRNKEVGGVVTNSYQARQLAQSQPCDIATADTPLS
jgi:hypothetical protein